MKRCFILPAVSLLILSSATLVAQEESEEDVFELSPFEADAGWRSGHRATSTLAGARIKTDLQEANRSDVKFYEIGAVIEGVTGESDPQLLSSDSVRVNFGIGFYDDREIARRQKLVELLAIAKERVEENPDFEFAPGSMLISEGDRKRKLSKRRAEYTSYARFTVDFPIQLGKSPLETTMQARQLVAGLGIESEVTKLYFGPAELKQDDPFFGLPTFARTDFAEGSPVQVSIRGGSLSGVTDRLHRPFLLIAPQVPVTLVKSADAVAVHFAATIQAEKKSDSDAEANRFLETARERFEADPALAFEAGAIQVAPATLKSEDPSLYRAHFTVSFKVAEGTSARDQVRKIRETAGALEDTANVSRIHYGPANLIVENPNRFRDEILRAIQIDLQRFDESLGEAFSVEPRIENASVRLNQFSESEVEIWMPYRYDVISNREREMEELRLLRDHEKALALANASVVIHCCKRDEPVQRN